MILKPWLTGLVLLGAAAMADELSAVSADQGRRPNVLFIAIDDLNNYALGLNPRARVRTPHMERLASRGVLFANAHCAAPVCNPSRVSVMTGVSPATSGVYTNRDDWRQTPFLNSLPTLPHHFREHGYRVVGGGKLYHAANLNPKMLEGYLDATPWHEYFPSKRRQLADAYVPPGRAVNGSNRFYGGRFDWQALDIGDEEMGDGKVVTWAEKQLASVPEKPLFLAVGIYRPHIPWYTPKKWFDEVPLDGIQLPRDPAGDMQDVSQTAVDTTKRSWHEWLVENDKWAQATQAYLASVRFADAMVGRLLDALDNGPLGGNTIIVLWSDHGYHLGHKQHWEKRVLWEQATQVPLVIVDKRFQANRGRRCASPVSLLDLYPTLSDLCGLGTPRHLEGRSLRPLLTDPNAPSQRVVVTTYKQGNHALRSERWRYIRYADGAEELYDHSKDPDERNNLAGLPDLQQVKNALRARIPNSGSDSSR